MFADLKVKLVIKISLHKVGQGNLSLDYCFFIALELELCLMKNEKNHRKQAKFINLNITNNSKTTCKTSERKIKRYFNLTLIQRYLTCFV